jgi:hypothetical protein
MRYQRASVRAQRLAQEFRCLFAHAALVALRATL